MNCCYLKGMLGGRFYDEAGISVLMNMSIISRCTVSLYVCGRQVPYLKNRIIFQFIAMSLTAFYYQNQSAHYHSRTAR
jgi:hypothetical protein